MKFETSKAIYTIEEWLIVVVFLSIVLIIVILRTKNKYKNLLLEVEQEKSVLKHKTAELKNRIADLDKKYESIFQQKYADMKKLFENKYEEKEKGLLKL